MPEPNRVNPAGELVATSARGTLMGNRGCLHDADGRIVRNSARKEWICCELAFEGRKRQLRAPGSYTELFFLDEATALAAGHRPCGTCRRDDARRFAHAWGVANLGMAPARVGRIDDQLSGERVDSARMLRSSVPPLPDGTMFRQEASGRFFLLHRGRALPWSFTGYGAPVDTRDVAGPIMVMTPASIIRALDAGYEPRVHRSAG